MVQSPSPSDAPAGAPLDRHEARRLEILRRAAAVFREKGYHRAGMREIAEGLGLRPGALYHYFASKDDLLLACQETSLDALLEGVAAIGARDLAPAEKIRRLARLHLGQTLEATGGSAAHLEFDALPPRHRRALLSRRDAYERAVRALVEEGVEKGAFRVVSPKLAALALLGALNWSVVWWRPEGGWRVDDVADTMADLILRGLEAAPREEENA